MQVECSRVIEEGIKSQKTDISFIIEIYLKNVSKEFKPSVSKEVLEA
jgi:hypothetical protein